MTSFALPQYGLAFDVPRGWSEQMTSTGHVLHGPDGPLAFASLVFQAAPNSPDLKTALESMQAQLDAQTPAMVAAMPTLVAGHPALSYIQEFAWLGTVRLRIGAIIAGPRGMIDVGCTAPRDAAAEAAAVFEVVLDSTDMF